MNCGKLNLSAAGHALIGAACAWPGVAVGAEISGNEIIVTGTPRETSMLETPADVSVLAGAEKRRREAASLGDTLDSFAGVDTIGTGDQVGKPVIRGLSGNRVRILSDEVSLDFQQFGVRHPPNIDPYIAERIEVVRGASSILYGSDAIGGVVNVISNRPPSALDGEPVFGGSASVGYQSAFRQITGALSVEGADGPFGFAGTLVARDSNGLVTPDEPTALETGDTRGPLVTGKVPFTDFNQVNGDLSLGYETPVGQIVLRYEGYRNEHNFVVPDPPPPDGDPLQAGGVGQDLENDIVHAFGEFDLGRGVTLNPSFDYARNLRVSNPGPPEPIPRSALPEAAALDIQRENFTGRLDVGHDEIFGLFAGRVGVEAIAIRQNSRGRVALTPGGSVDKYAAYLLEEVSFGDLILNVGGRIDHIETKGDEARTAQPNFLPDDASLREQSYTVATGSLGAVYRLTPEVSLAANVARGFRAPTLFELFVDGVHGGVAALQRGDPTLDEETSLSVDGSVRYVGERGRLKVTGYLNDISDYIFPAGTGMMNAGGLPIFQVSQQDAFLWGFDVDGAYSPTDWMEVRGYVQYTDGELEDGRQTPLLPPLKAGGEVEFSQSDFGVADEAFLIVGVSYADNQRSAGLLEPFGQFDSPPPPFGTGSTEAYTLVDLTVGGRVGPATLTVGAENLLDKAYRDFLDTYKNITLSPGRNIFVKLTTEF